MKIIAVIFISGLILMTASPIHAQGYPKIQNQEVGDLLGAREYERAVVVAQKALEIAEKKVGTDHLLVASRLEDLALLYDPMILGNPIILIEHKSLENLEQVIAQAVARVIPLWERALSIREKAQGPDHPDLAIRLSILALLYQEQHKYTQAETFYKRFLAIVEKAGVTDEDPFVSGVLKGMVRLYEEMGRNRDAIPIIKRVLANTEKEWGADHPRVALDLERMARLYSADGQYAQAELLYKRALAIFDKAAGSRNRKHGGWESFSVAFVLDGLAELDRAQGRYTQAEPLYKRALAILEKAHGPDDPRVAKILEHLAALYRATQRVKEAEALEQRVAHIRAILRSTK